LPYVTINGDDPSAKTTYSEEDGDININIDYSDNDI
jgi:hypothetical protein